MAPQILFANNAQSTLAGSISNTALSVNLAAGTGVLFPSPGAGQYFVGTFVSASNPQLNEIVHCTAVSGDTLTIVRAQESTTALNWNANDYFSNLLTAGPLAVFQPSVRVLLSTATAFYVSTTGSDSTGTGTSGAPWATLQHAATYVYNNLDLAGNTVTINVANGTYTGGVLVPGSFTGASGPLGVVFSGNTATPASCIVDVTGAACFAAVNGARFLVTGFRLISTSGSAPAGYGLYAGAGGSEIGFDHIDFNACTSHIATANGGQASTSGAASPYSISGAASTHLFANPAGNISIQGAVVTLTGTPAITTFASAEDLSVITANGVTFSGSATGQRYSVQGNSVIDTNGGGASYFPGNTSGGTATGGQYI